MAYRRWMVKVVWRLTSSSAIPTPSPDIVQTAATTALMSWPHRGNSLPEHNHLL